MTVLKKCVILLPVYLLLVLLLSSFYHFVVGLRHVVTVFVQNINQPGLAYSLKEFKVKNLGIAFWYSLQISTSDNILSQPYEE